MIDIIELEGLAQDAQKGEGPLAGNYIAIALIAIAYQLKRLVDSQQK